MANCENSQSKVIPTTESKESTKQSCIIKCHVNNPQLSALEIAHQFKTTVGYVWKVLSNARKPSKDIRGRNGRIFAHGKVYYEWTVMADTAAILKAPTINTKTGMKQIGFIKEGHPCSCQIHSNGHIIVWTHSTGWKEWLENQFTASGWQPQIARHVITQLTLGVSVIEAGVKPLDQSFLPNELSFETEWGVVIVKDNTPEKGVLELKLSIPDMQRYLGLPDIKKQLEVIEQGSITLNQTYKTVVALLLSQNNHWEDILTFLVNKKENDKTCSKP